MKIQINKDRSVELSELTEKDAIIWASSVFLNQPYPDNYDELISQEPLMSRDSLENPLGKYIIDNERDEYPSLSDIFPPSACDELINRTASLLQQSLKDPDKPKPKKYYVVRQETSSTVIEADSKHQALKKTHSTLHLEWEWKDEEIIEIKEIEERDLEPKTKEYRVSFVPTESLNGFTVEAFSEEEANEIALQDLRDIIEIKEMEE